MCVIYIYYLYIYTIPILLTAGDDFVWLLGSDELHLFVPEDDASAPG